MDMRKWGIIGSVLLLNIGQAQEKAEFFDSNHDPRSACHQITDKGETENMIHRFSKLILDEERPMRGGYKVYPNGDQSPGFMAYLRNFYSILGVTFAAYLPDEKEKNPKSMAAILSYLLRYGGIHTDPKGYRFLKDRDFLNITAVKQTDADVMIKDLSRGDVIVTFEKHFYGIDIRLTPVFETSIKSGDVTIRTAPEISMHNGWPKTPAYQFEASPNDKGKTLTIKSQGGGLEALFESTFSADDNDHQASVFIFRPTVLAQLRSSNICSVPAIKNCTDDFCSLEWRSCMGLSTFNSRMCYHQCFDRLSDIGQESLRRQCLKLYYPDFDGSTACSKDYVGSPSENPLFYHNEMYGHFVYHGFLLEKELMDSCLSAGENVALCGDRHLGTIRILDKNPFVSAN